MQIVTVKELLGDILNCGISLSCISQITQIDTNILQTLAQNEDNISLLDDEKASYLLVLLIQICRNKPSFNLEKYFISTLESLTDYFRVPRSVVARYAGIDEQELNTLAAGFDVYPNSKKYNIMLDISHLFQCFIRDPRFSK